MKEQEVPRVNHLEIAKEVEGWRRQGEAYWNLVSRLGYLPPENGQLPQEPSVDSDFSLPGASKVAPVVLISALLLSCARSEEEPALVSPALSTATATAKAGETPRPVQPTTTKEVPLTIEQQAKEVVLNAWLQLFNTTQKDDQDKATLDAKVFNTDRWHGYIKDIIRTNSHPAQEPMEVKWVASKFYSYPGAGDKIIGEIQINNVRIRNVSMRSLTDADRANGLSYDGVVTISFIRRYHANYMRIRQLSSQQEIMDWLPPPEQTPLPPFSQWKDEVWGLRVRLRNGRWERDLVDRTVNKDDSILRNMELPSQALGIRVGLITSDCITRPPADWPCKLVEMDKLPSK